MRNPPIIVLGIIAISLAVLAWFNFDREARVADQLNWQQYERTKQVVSDDVSASRPLTADKYYREEWRAEQELTAQQNMAWWNRVSTVATCIGVVLLIVTLWETSQTAIAAAQAASAAENTLSHSKDISERELRAYVCLVGGVLTVQNLKVKGSVKFKNSGQTPAFNVRSCCRIEVGTYDGVEHLMMEPPDPKVYTASSIAGPGGEFEFTSERNLIADFTDIVEQRKAIFFSGVVEYTDAFGVARHFIFNCRASGELQSRDRAGNAHWPLTPHPSGYLAN